MTKRKRSVCPVERAGHLDHRFRRWFQNPMRILRPHVKEGLTAMDFGCGPGFFTLDMARLAGPTGRVIAADLQEGMLDIVRSKIHGTELASRITLHRVEENAIGLSELVDFVLVFYMVHELPDQRAFFDTLVKVVKPHGSVLVVEPPIHVTKADFEATIRHARDAGFEAVDRPRYFLNKVILLRKTGETTSVQADCNNP
jgi:ubiquinone/menaquinone biosynthesis C-methylase UbiE